MNSITKFFKLKERFRIVYKYFPEHNGKYYIVERQFFFFIPASKWIIINDYEGYNKFVKKSDAFITLEEYKKNRKPEIINIQDE